ncbi:MAG: RNA polymerase sigma factor [Tenericutes bacterium]|nr:RNA polymerase sigma factor [Mycoplasmatota bacterium]
MVNYDQYVDALIEKDDEAFRIVYENTKKGVFSMIISIVNNKAATEDLMQDTYMKMIKYIKQYKKGRNFYAWLIQIAKNTAFDYYRKEKRVTVIDPQLSDKLNEGTVKENTSYEVIDMIKDLDEIEKQVVLLRIVSNAKFKDIALSIDKPIGTVLWIYQKAIKKLQNTYGEE